MKIYGRHFKPFKDWGFFKVYIKYKKCIKKFSMVDGLDEKSMIYRIESYDGSPSPATKCLREADKLWNKRKRRLINLLWAMLPIFIVSLFFFTLGKLI